MKIISYFSILLALVILDEYNVPLKPVALTEWNIFAMGSKQSCLFINGIHATLVPGELIKNKCGPVNDLLNIKTLSQKINNGIKLVLPPYSVQFLLVEDHNK